jgi:hypothetical protein
MGTRLSFFPGVRHEDLALRRVTAGSRCVHPNGVSAGQLDGATVLEGCGGTGTVPALVVVVVVGGSLLADGLVAVVGAPGATVVGADGDVRVGVPVGVLLRVGGRVVVAVVARVAGVVCSTWPDPPPVPPSPLAVPAWVDGGRT